MSHVKRFFSIYGLVLLLYAVIYGIARFSTIIMFGAEFQVGLLEWCFLGLIMVIFLHFFVTIVIPKTAVFVGELVLGKNN